MDFTGCEGGCRQGARILLRGSRVFWILFLAVWIQGAPASPEQEEGPTRHVNPHFRPGECGVCHPGGFPTRLTYKQTEELCNLCHAQERSRVEIHPSGIAAHRGAVRKVPPEFPLWRGRLTCATCHDLLIQCKGGAAARERNPSFLRGGPYGEAWEICFRCHDPSLYDLFDPHDQIDDQGGMRKEICLYCHEPPGPREQPDAVVGKPIRDICSSCHRLKNHPTGTDHMRKPSRKVQVHLRRVTRRKKIWMPLNERGEIYCATCHNPHEKGVFQEGDPRAGGAEGDKPGKHRIRIPPEQLCVVCHDRRMYSGASVTQNQ